MSSKIRIHLFVYLRCSLISILLLFSLTLKQSAHLGNLKKRSRLMRPRTSFFLAGFGLLALAFALGILTARPSNAQYGQPTPYPEGNISFPRQRDLWQFTAMTDQTWNAQLNGHAFAVTADRQGRLPVVTGFNLTNTILYRVENNGSRTRIAASNYTENSPYANGSPPYESRPGFDHSTGIVLRTGTYVIRMNSRYYDAQSLDQTTQTVLLSGYWSNP